MLGLKRWVLALFAALLVVFVTPAVSAKPSKADAAEAKKAVKEAQKHQRKKDWEAARDAYERAAELDPSPVNKVRLARAETELGHLLEARELLEKALEEKKGLNWGQRARAKQALKKLEKRIPTLSLELPEGFSGTISVDDEAVSEEERKDPIAVNPGTREVRAEAEGYLPFKESIEVAEGETKSVTILLTEKPPPPPEPEPEEPQVEKSSGSANRTLGYVSLAVGGAGLVVGTAMGLAARSTRSELDDSCGNDVCSEADRELYDKGKTQANIATAGFVVGGVGIGLGAFFLLTAEDDDSGEPAEDTAKVRVRPVIGPGQVGVVGRF